MYSIHVYISYLFRRVGVQYNGPHVYKDSSNESHVDMPMSVRGRDVFIIHTGYKLVNNFIKSIVPCYTTIISVSNPMYLYSNNHII